MDSRSLLIKNTGIYALGDIMPRVFNLIVFPVLTTHLSPEEFGIINYINTVDTFMSVVSVLGLNTFFLAFYYKEKDEISRKNLYSTISYFIFGFTLFVSILLHIFGPNAFRAWGSNVSFYPYISIGIIMNIFNITTYLPTCLYRVQENPLPLTIINIVKSFIILGVSVIAVTAIKGSAYEVLLGRCIVTALFSIVFIFATRHYFVFNFNIQTIKKALEFSIPLVPGSLAYYTYSLFDRVLIDKYLTLRDLGLYTTAATLAMILNIIYYGAYRAFEPYFFQHFGEDSFKQKFIKVRDALLFVVLVGSLIISIFAKEVLQIFASAEYGTAYLYVPVIAIGVVASAMSLVYGTIIIARKKTVMNTVITIIGCVISLGLNILFLKTYGAMVAAVSFAISFSVVLLCNIIVSKINIPHMRAIISMVIIIIVSLLATYLLNYDLWLNIIIKSVISIFAILILMRFMGFNIKMIFNMAKKIVSKA